MEIKFTQEHIDQCNKFAEEIDTSFYSTRNQDDVNKRKKDQVVGKLGEIATYSFLKEKYPSLSPPDFKIYSANQKSWDFDLKADAINLHCKSQELKSSKKFGESWTFQKGNVFNKSYDKEVFERTTPNQYVSFVIVDLADSSAKIKAIVDLDFLFKKDLFKKPVLSKLRESNKSVVYFHDMKQFTTKLWVL